MTVLVMDQHGYSNVQNTIRFGLSDLIKWLETQPAKAKYNYFDYGHCLLQQFLEDQGYHDFEVTPNMVYRGPIYRPYAVAPLPKEWDYVSRGNRWWHHFTSWRTFGSALERAREVEARHPNGLPLEMWDESQPASSAS